MKKSTVLTVLSAACTLALVSCTVFQSGTAVVKHEPGDSPRMTAAPYKGIYTLYDSGDTVAKVSHALNKGEQIGFKMVEGRLLAVAGSNTHSVPDPTHSLYWRLASRSE